MWEGERDTVAEVSCHMSRSYMHDSPTHHYLPPDTRHHDSPTHQLLYTRQFVRFVEGDPNPNPNPNLKQFVRFLEGDRAALSEHLTDQQQQLGQLQAHLPTMAYLLWLY